LALFFPVKLKRMKGTSAHKVILLTLRWILALFFSDYLWQLLEVYVISSGLA
jgi:hypothetical protein